MLNRISYSVIIPHKNAFLLLERCVQSIPERDDIEVIIVDDNSNEFYDVELSGFYNRSNVKYFKTKDGLGAGYARNVALQYASGTWLIFADADDFFVNDAWRILDEYKDSSFDIIYFRSTSVDSNTLMPVERSQTYNCLIENWIENDLEKTNLLRLRHDVPWGKMIRKNIVFDHGIRFDQTKYCNDTIFSTQVGLYVKNVKADLRPLYCVTYRQGSLVTHRTLEADSIRYQVILRKNELLKKNGFSKYQLSLLSYYRLFWKWGLVPFVNAVFLGVKYKADFVKMLRRFFVILFSRLLGKKIYFDLTDF